ncbi:MAG: SOS response-associated peptidase, partial [Mycolicibacterium aromaticivorans]|nr:SOS response-associated peptidase [Mycolicibacterium aromaticivorans]
MCGRFAVTTDPALLAEKIHANGGKGIIPTPIT